MSRPSICRP